MTIDQAKPSPTPWRSRTEVLNQRLGEILDAKNETLGTLPISDALRAVACVNKCENLTDEELADDNVRFIILKHSKGKPRQFVLEDDDHDH